MSRRHVTAPRWSWRTWGRPDRPTLLLLHGFTGTGAFWAPLAAAWAEDWHVLAPDLPGHGDSHAPTDGYGLADAADTVASALAGPATVVGYSLGGRLALHLAARHPERVARLVLVGASPGLADPADRDARISADAAWIERLEAQGLEAFLEAWEALPLFAQQRLATPEHEVSAAQAERQAWLRSLRAGQSAAGLASAMDAFGLGRQDDLRPELARLTVPTWWVAGAEDAKFVAIAREMAAAMPDARSVVVPGCGHNVAFERPEAIADLVTTFGGGR